jgi:hypothetical protein
MALNFQGASSFINTGTLAATGGGVLALTGSVSNGQGRVEAQNGGTVNLNSFATISGGTLATSGTGAMFVTSNASFVGVDVLSGSLVQVLPGGTLALQANNVNNGTIRTANGSGVAAYSIAGAGTLSGSGTLRLDAASGGALGNVGGAGTLTNAAPHTIAGAGEIGLNTLSVVNTGTISADVAGSVLRLDPSVSGMTNSGTLQTLNGGILRLSHNGGGPFDNASGTIQVAGSTGTVELIGGAMVIGGTISSTGANARIQVPTNQSAILSDVFIAPLSKVVLGANGQLSLTGAITNHGVISAADGASSSFSVGVGTTTLSGSGELLLGNGTLNPSTLAGFGTLNNNQTVRGFGNIGNNTMSLRNSGTINANVSGRTLVIDPDTGTWTNNGTMSASNGGILELNGTNGGGLLGNTGGSIIANNNSNVRLHAVTINGGTLDSVGAGSVSMSATTASTLQTVFNEAQVILASGNTLTVTGGGTNDGVFNLFPATPTPTFVVVNGATPYTNSGSILMQGQPNTNVLQGTGVLNNSGLIEGFGRIAPSAGQNFTINNSGILSATNGQLLEHSSSGTLLIQNSGTIRATTGGTFRTTSPTNITNSTGSILVNAGATFEHDNGTINGGTVTVDGTFINNAYMNVSAIVGSGAFLNDPGAATAGHVRATTVLNTATLTIAANGTDTGTSRVTSYNNGFSTNLGLLEMNDNDLVADYTSFSLVPGAASMIVSARNGGAWDEVGITSRFAREHPTGSTTLGVIEASDYIDVTGSNVFSGQTIDATTALIKYTWYGDTDFNGFIDGDDYARIDNGFNTGASGWFNGDCDLNGFIDGDDYALIDNAFNSQTGTLRLAIDWISGDNRATNMDRSPALRQVRDHFNQFGASYGQALLASVPEPGTGVMCLAAAAGVLLRRRRR